MLLYKSGIYKIINIINNKFYVGSAFNLKKRKFDHFRNLSLNKHVNKHLQRAYNKYGKDHFKFEILEIVQRYENESKLEFRKRLVYEKEQFYLDNLLFAQEYIKNENNKFLELGYNLNPTASGTLGRKFTNRKHIKLTEEHKKKISENAKNNPNFGFKNRKHTEESKEKTRKANLGKKHTEETKQKIRDNAKINPNYGSRGYKWTKDQLENISKIRKGSIPWNKDKKGLQKCSEETKRKMSEYQNNTRWFNDGIKNYRLHIDDPRIQHLNLGRLKNIKNDI